MPDHKFQLISFNNKLPGKLIRVSSVALLNSGATVYNRLRFKRNILALCGVHLRYRLPLYHASLNGTIFLDVRRNSSGGKKRASFFFWIDATNAEFGGGSPNLKLRSALVYRNYSPSNSLLTLELTKWSKWSIYIIIVFRHFIDVKAGVFLKI